MSLAVIESSSLQQQHLYDVDALQFAVPGLSVQETGVNRRIEIRGVSNVFGSGGLIGEYIDDAAVSVSPTLSQEQLDIRTYDLARVEVLRGPQGTLYGEGSIGGTIRYITNSPDLSGFDFSGNALATYTHGGAPGQLIQLTINSPIVHNKLGLRAAAESEHTGGWVDQPAADRNNINSSDLTHVRLEGLWKPLSSLQVDITQTFLKNSYSPNEGAESNDIFVEPFGLTLTPRLNSHFSISNATVTYDLDRVTLLSSTTYFHNTLDWHDIAGRTQAGPLPAGPVFLSITGFAAYDEADLSEEIRLSSATRTPWRWTIGGFGKRYGDELSPYSGYFGLPGPLPPEAPGPGEALYSRSWSAFADTSYELLGRLTVGAGVRYFRDAQTFISGNAQRGTFESTDPRFYVQYGLSKSTNLYINVAKGFRSGGFNALGFPRYAPESLWSYELGSKMRLYHRTLSIDADVFYSSYDNYVTIGSTLASPVNIYRNGGAVHIKGGEANVTWQPTTAWTASISGDYINGRFVSVSTVNPVYIPGDPLDAVPRYQVSASVRRFFLLGDKPSYIRVDYTQRAPETYRLRIIGPWYYSESDHVYLLDASLGTQLTDALGLNVFVKNILNDRAYLDPYVIENASGRTQPRNVGIEFTARFH